MTVFKCPICNSDLRYRSGRKGRFLGCSGYPSCRFALSVSAEESDREIQDKLEKKRRIYTFLEEKHNPNECDICHGEKDAENFFNSLFHWFERNSSLTQKQYDSIKSRIETYFEEEENEEYSYPPRDSVTAKDEVLLRRNDLW